MRKHIKFIEAYLKFGFWFFFTVGCLMVLYRVFSGENHVEFNFGGMPLN